MPLRFYLLFLISVIVHNCEEGLRLPIWTEMGKGFTVLESGPFAITLVVITLPLVLYLILKRYNTKRADLLFIGYVGMMFLNTFLPHLFGSIVIKEITPGTVSSVLLVFPVALFTLVHAIKNSELTLKQIAISTTITTAVIVAVIVGSYTIQTI